MSHIKTVRSALATLFLSTVSTTTVAASSVLTEDEAIQAAYNGTVEPDLLFSQNFLNIVPEEQVRAISANLLAKFGPIDSIDGENGNYVLATATHQMDVKIALDKNGLVSSLLFHPAEALTASLDETLEAINSAADEVSYLLLRNNKQIKSANAEKPLAVGSAFKLGILKVLVDDINAGALTWKDVYELRAEDKSLPSGELQHFPDNAPLTLHSVASLMIANSDNTGTDMLMRILGAERVADALGIETAMTTKQFFAFKNDAALREKYLTAPKEEQRIQLEKIQNTPLPENVNIGYHNQGFEWYIPATKLCALLTKLGPLDIFDINSGPLNKSDWDQVRFKGGSEDGVLNLSAYTEKEGTSYCISTTLNHSEQIDLNKISGLFRRAFRQMVEMN